MFNYLWPHALQHTRLPCPPLFPKICSNSCPWNWWCYLTISNWQRMRWLGSISEIDICKLHEVQGWYIRGGIDVIWVRMLLCVEIQRTIRKQSREWRKINKLPTWKNHMEKDFEFEGIMAFSKKWKVRKAQVREKAWSQPAKANKRQDMWSLWSLLREQGDAESVRHGSEVLVAQSYWGSPGSAVHGVLQGRVLEWAAKASSKIHR